MAAAAADLNLGGEAVPLVLVLVASLGLATVYGIVKGHGGEIQVSSAVDEGTTFEIPPPGYARDEAAGAAGP